MGEAGLVSRARGRSHRALALCKRSPRLKRRHTPNRLVLVIGGRGDVVLRDSAPYCPWQTSSGKRGLLQSCVLRLPFPLSPSLALSKGRILCLRPSLFIIRDNREGLLRKTSTNSGWQCRARRTATKATALLSAASLGWTRLQGRFPLTPTVWPLMASALWR